MICLCFSRCDKFDCNEDPLENTVHIAFTLKDKNTGANILPVPLTSIPAPDSIKLKNLQTGAFYPLSVGYAIVMGVQNSTIYSRDYNRPAGVTDTLIFYFGNSIPDTLRVEVGLVNGWRGDECPTVRDAGVRKVTLRNQVLVETNDDDVLIPLQK